jgi:hypothetical protein
MAEFGCGKGIPARSILHGCGIKSEWLAQNDDREAITRNGGRNSNPFEVGVGSLGSQVRTGKTLVRKILFSQPNWGVLDELN